MKMKSTEERPLADVPHRALMAIKALHRQTLKSDPTDRPAKIGLQNINDELKRRKHDAFL